MICQTKASFEYSSDSQEPSARELFVTTTKCTMELRSTSTRKRGRRPPIGSLLPLLMVLPLAQSFSPVSIRPSSSTRLYSDQVEDYRRHLSSISRGDDDEDVVPEKGASATDGSFLDKKGTEGEALSSPPGSRLPTVVMKFGGSSLANADRVDHVAQLIASQTSQVIPKAVVCSAMGKTTNGLLQAGETALLEGVVSVDDLRKLHMDTLDAFGLGEDSEDEWKTRENVQTLWNECEQLLQGVRLLQECSPKSLDRLVSYGERCSVRIVAARLRQLGIDAAAYDAWDLGLFTNGEHGDAKLLDGFEASIGTKFSEKVPEGQVAIVTGFIGQHLDPDESSSSPSITTLGRGGSDLTATAFGAALKCDEIQVWKDVDGILTCDPRVVPAAVPVPSISFEEASELAYFGAQVLHPIAMQPARKHNIPVRVKNSYNPSAVGTMIGVTEAVNGSGRSKDMPHALVTAITYKRAINVLDITSTQMLGAYGFLSRVFSLFEKHKLSVDVLASSEVSISLTLDKKQDLAAMDRAVIDLQDQCADVERKQGRSILTLIADVHQSSKVLAQVFSVFAEKGIQVEMMSQGASKVNISFVVLDADLDLAVSSLHACFFEPKGLSAESKEAEVATVGE